MTLAHVEAGKNIKNVTGYRVAETKKDLTGLLELSNAQGNSEPELLASSELGLNQEQEDPSASFPQTEPMAADDFDNSPVLDFAPQIHTSQTPSSETSEFDIPTLPEAENAPVPQDIQGLDPSPPTSHTPLPAAFPFHVLITGALKPIEQEKLLDLISHHNMGIRAVDLEPQFAADRILLPRISEYAAILIVHTLRTCSAQIRVFPSDSQTASKYLASSSHENTSEQKPQAPQHSPHPAESIPVTKASFLPDDGHVVLLDTIFASASLQSKQINVERSKEYERLIDALQTEIKYKAYRKGATAVLNFSVQLTPLDMASHYKLTASGSAVKLGQ